MRPTVVVVSPVRAHGGDGWENTTCPMCGTLDAKSVLTLSHRNAPNGVSNVVQCTRCGLCRLNPRPAVPQMIDQPGATWSTPLYAIQFGYFDAATLAELLRDHGFATEA